MSLVPPEIESRSSSLEAFLLGPIDFDVALALQQRLVERARDRDDGQITLLLCEHPPIVTVGRGGSPTDVAMQAGLIRRRQVDVRWVNRGGDAMLHCMGQLAIYPIVPLRWHGFSVGEYVDRLSSGICDALGNLNVVSAATGRDFVGRSGQLASIGVAVRHWITYYGAYLNVCPPMGLFRLVANKGSGTFFRNGRPGASHKMDLPPFLATKIGSLVAERCGPVKMTSVRATLIQRLAECFGCDRYHLYTGHPMLRRTVRRIPDDS